MPFDFLLNSLSEDMGARAVCVVLSGTGADGSIGLKAVKDKGGLVIAQEPDEAGYDGMPRSAIMTGAVDLVLPVAEIPDALITHQRGMTVSVHQNRQPQNAAQDWLPRVVELLRTRTAHDFTLYKHGTLERRIERRMAITLSKSEGMDRYLAILQNDDAALELLAKDLLINVTGFFRDPKVYDYLAKEVVPALIRDRSPDQPLRIWVAGCSTGEEAYSLAMLFAEQIAEAKRNIKLQMFASDIDADAVASARAGLYPRTIEAAVSPERLARFFSKEGDEYRVSPEIRESVLFTVQDVLSDPPFSRLDMVSCRNLLIYLRPEAQTKIISLFHFALRDRGVLLLGNSETIEDPDEHFETISKAFRLYRRIGRSRPAAFSAAPGSGEAPQTRMASGLRPPLSRQAALGELCQRLVLDSYAPAAVLINRKHECLYSLGPTDHYLRVAPGRPTHDLLAMAHPDVRIKLRSALQQSARDNARVVVPGGRINHEGAPHFFSISAQPVLSEGEALQLVCFLDAPTPGQSANLPAPEHETPRVAALEQELDATKAELQSAIRNLEISSEEQKAINEEVLSVNEEFQSANEELLTSKEELQSLNEELTALNVQLQETLDRQRTTANDLQNIIYSTNVATLFLDTSLKIRFFTPATKALFRIIPGDIGRPLADLSQLSIDKELLPDARAVLKTRTQIEREIGTQDGIWYTRLILPYRTQDDRVDGVVITFVDATERKCISDALDAAKRKADQANVAKSRFLAAASHDLRQPLQTLTLLQSLLARAVEGEKAQRLVGRLEDAVAAMSGMLNTLLDINQIEAGVVQVDLRHFSVNDLFARLRDEFTDLAQAQGLSLRILPCSLSANSDARLLEQIVRNLLSNALKYTKNGKILLGCRRRGTILSIEIWDTGVGIPQEELQTIFEEYHQLGNATHDRSGGLGLGLSIVQRLVDLLGYRVHVRSNFGKGSVFAIEIDLPRSGEHSKSEAPAAQPHETNVRNRIGADEILIVEDDHDVRELLGTLLTGEGYAVSSAHDGASALALLTKGAVDPDLILSDYNLPNGLDGAELALQIRATLRTEIPVIILTGDISTAALRNITLGNCVKLHKPVKLQETLQAIQKLLPPQHVASAPRIAQSPEPSFHAGAPVVFIVDDDASVRATLRSVLEDDGKIVEDYDSCEAFLAAYRPGRDECLLLDAYMPGMNGLELLEKLRGSGHVAPTIMITGASDVQIAVQAMKAGASDFIEKPVGRDELLASVERALAQSRDSNKQSSWRQEATERMANLTPRQRQIVDMVLAGVPSKNIAADLGISQRTVENHRASIMRKTGAKSMPALARLAVAAAD